MADPTRLQVLKLLTAHLGGITPANGFESNLAGQVFRGRALLGADDPVPCVSIIENPRAENNQLAGENGAARYGEFPLFVQGWVKTEAENPTDPAYRLAEDVLMRLGEIIATDNVGEPLIPSVYKLGGLIGEMTIGNYVVRPPSENSNNKAIFYLTLDITLANES